MASQIGANSRARDSILGHNLHSEEHERNLMSFPSILHFDPSLPSPAFSDPAAVWQGTSRPALQCQNDNYAGLKGASSATPTRLRQTDDVNHSALPLKSKDFYGKYFMHFLYISVRRLSGLWLAGSTHDIF